MYHLYLGLKLSFSYFSILPLPLYKEENLSHKSVLNCMLLMLPLVGLTLGVITVSIFTTLSHLSWYGAIIAAILYMVLYGFIHTEAIIDVADAIYARHSGKDAHTIIKEPTVGAIGVLYGVVAVLLKISGIVWLFVHGIVAEFIAIVIISRLSLLTLIILHDFHSSFVTQLKEALDYWYVMMIFILFMIGGSAMITPYFLILLILGVIFGFIISLFLAAKLHFVNGDVLGTTLEGVEILLFLVVGLFVGGETCL